MIIDYSETLKFNADLIETQSKRKFEPNEFRIVIFLEFLTELKLRASFDLRFFLE